MYTKNEYYWSEPNIENSYYAGFIAADGCLSVDRHSKSLVVKITEKDKIILERLQHAIQYSGPLHKFAGRFFEYGTGRKTSYTKPSYRLKISKAVQYHLDLSKWYNITPRKTLTLQPPNITDLDHIKAYIVGYFDGDGCLSWSRANLTPCLSIVGTKNFMLWMKSVLESLTDEHFYLRDLSKYNQHCHTLDKNGVGVYKFIESLSNIDVPRLERKWSINHVCRNLTQKDHAVCD